MDSYPRETVELVSVVVTVDGTPVTENVQVAVTPAYDGTRPADWVDATVLGDSIGYMLGALTATAYPATFRVWAKVTDTPEVPVVDCGTFKLT